MSRFVLSTENFNYLDTRNITVGDNNYDYGENISIDVPLMFSSTLLVKGLDNLKINGSTKTDLNVKIMKNGQKLNLQLGPKFNYKKHELFLSLHSQSNITIILNFNLEKFKLTYPAKHSTDSNDTYEITTGNPRCVIRRHKRSAGPCILGGCPPTYQNDCHGQIKLFTQPYYTGDQYLYYGYQDFRNVYRVNRTIKSLIVYGDCCFRIMYK